MLQLIERCLEKYARSFLKNLTGIGGTEIDDALKTLDKLTQKESWTIITQNLKVTLAVDETLKRVENKVVATATDVDQVKRLSSNVISAYYRALPIFSGNQFRESIQRWLSAPDPSTNHNIACDTHHKKPASWFSQGTIFQEWKSTGSFLWVHGKRLPRPLPNLTSSDITSFCIIAGSGKSILWFMDS
jgi:hypothetical protein